MKFMRKKKEVLNNKTPNWFKEWNSEYFIPVKNQSSRNEKLIYILLVALLGTSVAGDAAAKALITLIGN